MDFLEATKGVFRSTRLVHHSAHNKLEILRESKANAAPNSLEEQRWGDLIIRARWCTDYLGKEVKGRIDSGLSNLIAKCIYEVSGQWIAEVPPLRIITPISFSKEPCSVCKSLESSYFPNDVSLRDLSIPWETRYAAILQALVADSFKIIGSGNYFYAIINSYRGQLTGKTPFGYDWEDCFRMWDIGMDTSQRFLDTGKTCYSLTERNSYTKLHNVTENNREKLGVDMAHKYCTTGPDALKAQGGLFALNTELLCQDCKGNVEDDPIKIEI